MRPFFSFFACAAFACLSAGTLCAAPSGSLGNVTFVGDSITQGFSGHASYRYQFWKGLVDNKLVSGKDYKFTGSINGSWHSGTTDPVDALTPSYAGQQFDNTHEGHYNWRASWIAGSEALPDSETTNNRGSGTAADWVGQYDSDTIFVMLGTNDLYKGRTSEQLVNDVHSIVSTYQEANPNARIYVLSVTPPNGAPAVAPKAIEANRLAGEQAAGWSTGSSQVSYLDVNNGLGTGGMNSDKWHPKAQGELIIAGNLLKALGLNRTGGLERRAQLSTSYTPAATDVIGSGDPKTAWTFSGTSATLATASGNSALSHNWNAAAGDFTLEFTVHMADKGLTNNAFAVWAGNGSTGGSLLITEDAVQWGLFGSSPTTLYLTDTTSGELTFRLAYTQGDAEAGIKAGYYLWLDGVLIGDALAGINNTEVIKDRLLLGAYTSAQVSYADVSDISFETGAAWAPLLPEPASATLLLGGLGVLVVRRRRRPASTEARPS